MSLFQLRKGLVALGFGVALLVAAGLLGCSSDDLTPSSPSGDYLATNAGLGGSATVDQAISASTEAPPSGLVTVNFFSESLTFWPYTGRDFSSVTVDPINLIFVGEVDPAQIRAALMGLDGDRTSFGYPPAPPFNMTWVDAIGDVQTCYAEDGGWVGSVVQLQLGDYNPLRFHLRLFQTKGDYGDGGTWTLGAAHFELLIPGTPNHEVLSWEKAKEIVIVDMIRSGLLDMDVPMMPTQVITQAPDYREILPFIYNELPPELVAFIEGPAQPVTDPVPLANSGEAMMLNVVNAASVEPGVWSSDLTIEFDQVVPKPFCSDGPADWVYITGPVYLTQQSEVDSEGHYQYTSNAKGHLTAVPVDITQNPPMPAGMPFKAVIGDNQNGSTGEDHSRVQFRTRRIAPQDGGAEILMTRLMVSWRGGSSYRAESKCLSP
jgi:hypothetical protein